GNVRDARARLDAREKDRLGCQLDCRGVEDDVDLGGPVGCREDRVGRVSPEELRARHAAILPTATRATRGRPAASIARWARWNASVDSAPSLAFTSSSP